MGSGNSTRTLLTATVVGAAVAVLGGCSSESERAELTADASPVSSAPAPSSSTGIRLTAPPTLLDKTYEKSADTDETKRLRKTAQKSLPAGTTSVLAVYRKTGHPDSALTLSGAYGGDLGDRKAALDSMFNSLGFTNAAPDAKRKQFPAGEHGEPALECETAKVGDGVFAPVCAWAQKTDAGVLIATDATYTRVDAVDLPAFARTTTSVHKEIASSGAS